MVDNRWYRLPFLLIVIGGITTLIFVSLGGHIHRWELIMWIAISVILAIIAAFPPDL